MNKKEMMNLVFVGHVDHGKSTLLGRLLADTNSLPDGKLEDLREYCKKNSKQFEYAFLLDALKDEQSQGITIDVAKTFFSTEKRDYIINDAPGHIEFLKNMITGASRAEGAVLLIDANEGIKENSKRHAYMLSMLGIDQVIVVINKMDLIDYNKEKYEKIKTEYKRFLKKINIKPSAFIAISAKLGDNVAEVSENMDWFDNNTILSLLDTFKKEKQKTKKAFRMPIQDVYKFTNNDSRRIIAGKAVSGKIEKGDDVIFCPSLKRSKIKSVEEFKNNTDIIKAGESSAVTLEDELYIKRGEIMCKDNGDLPHISNKLKANIFWMGKEPLKTDKEYTLKLASKKVKIKIESIEKVLNSSSLDLIEQNHIKKHEVGTCIIKTYSEIAYDSYNEMKETGRFVIVDDYNIKGGGIITEKISDKKTNLKEEVLKRDKNWDKSNITKKSRETRFAQSSSVILIAGKSKYDKKSIAKDLEKKLFNMGRMPYFLGIRNILRGLNKDIKSKDDSEHIRRLAEVSHILMDSGLITIVTASNLSKSDYEIMETIIGKDNLFIISYEKTESKSDLILKESDSSEKIINYLKSHNIIYSN